MSPEERQARAEQARERTRNAWRARYPGRAARWDAYRADLAAGRIKAGDCDICELPGEPRFGWAAKEDGRPDTPIIGWRCSPCWEVRREPRKPAAKGRTRRSMSGACPAPDVRPPLHPPEGEVVPSRGTYVLHTSAARCPGTCPTPQEGELISP